MQTNDKLLTDLLVDIKDGKIQLPDFQRSWVWDDNRIKSLIASVIHNYPIGAAMFLGYGNENVRFKYRPIEGVVNDKKIIPEYLILDGQQRLTSLYAALYSKKPVHTQTDKNKEIYRYYYISIEKALDPNSDDEELIISVPETRIRTSDFGRKIELDLSTREKEFENKMFPLNIILNTTETFDWLTNYQKRAFELQDVKAVDEMNKFNMYVVATTLKYQIPVISLDKDTPKEAVCRVFENVNTGGVSLTVFELITAVFAMDDFELRVDWENRRGNYFTGDIINSVTSTDFLTALTLLASYAKGGTVSCKKKDVLNLSLDEYKRYADQLSKGFIEAESILQEERIFISRDLPYSTQLIPLAVICTVLLENNKIKITNVKNRIKEWYWCGVFGELYGSANETRFANDVSEVLPWILEDGKTPRTIDESYFNPTRLLTLQSRQSAAYKGIMALILKNHCCDFISGREMDFSSYKSENIDIHHIFPRNYCEKMRFPKKKWNSIINKTPISYSTNREIGGVAPSVYLHKIEQKGEVNSDVLNQYLETHLINWQLCRSDSFDAFILDRAKKLLSVIELATGKVISGKDTEDVIREFGNAL